MTEQKEGRQAVVTRFTEGVRNIIQQVPTCALGLRESLTTVSLKKISTLGVISSVALTTEMLLLRPELTQPLLYLLCFNYTGAAAGVIGFYFSDYIEGDKS